MRTIPGLLLVLGAALALPAGALAQDANKKVTARIDRERTLEVVARLLAETDPGRIELLRSTRSPFLRPEPAAAQPTEEDLPAPVAAAPVRLSNQQALQMVAERLRPSGSIIQGNNRILMLAGGGRLRVGDELPLTVNNEEYRVVVESITQDSFVLRLGGQTLTLSTNPALPTGSVSFDRPAPAPTPEPAPESAAPAPSAP